MALYHKDTHGIHIRQRREDVQRLLSTFRKQLAENTKESEENPDFNLHAANKPVYTNMLAIGKQLHKRAFVWELQFIYNLANKIRDESLRKEYDDTLSGFHSRIAA